MSAILRLPALLFSAGVEQARRLPGARLAAPFAKWLPRILLSVAAVLLLLWGAEVSPERVSLADLAAGKLGHLQTWIIITGDLAEERGSSDQLHLYRLTDPEAPNAYLIVRSYTAQAIGRTTISGRIEGGTDGVPPGYAWSATLDADEVLAAELPPPTTAFALIAVALVVLLARHSRYPMFTGQAPGEALPATSALRVTVRSESGAFDRAAVQATLSFLNAEPGTAQLTIGGSRRLPVRLHSAFTTVDVGVLHRLSGSEPALRVRSENDDLTLAFGSARERDSVFSALRAASPAQRGARAVGRATSSEVPG
jgi:hypothetical protein